ncbi:MAG: hypothetical protein HZA54_18780, partial [Planctomycetes bacterium]|nr:hypothetical protein [Planctomycetota bacterium]
MSGLLSFARRRIGAQIALALVLVSIVPLLGVGLLILGLIESSLSRQVQGVHDSLLDASSTLLDEYLRNSRDKLTALAGV